MKLGEELAEILSKDTKLGVASNLFRWKVRREIDIFEALPYRDGRSILDIFEEKGEEP
jgi:hypothetical protein